MCNITVNVESNIKLVALKSDKILLQTKCKKVIWARWQTLSPAIHPKYTLKYILLTFSNILAREKRFFRKVTTRD